MTTVLSDTTRFPLMGRGGSYFHLRDLRLIDQSRRVPLTGARSSVKISDLASLSPNARIPSLGSGFYRADELLAATAPLMVLDAVPAGDISTTVAVTGTWTYAVPTGVTAQWDAGAIAGVVTDFAADSDAGTWSATVSTPDTAGTYTLTVTGTGPNNDDDTSGDVVITDPGP